MRKKVVPIVAGNIKYLGLSIPEWTLSLSPMTLYVIILQDNWWKAFIPHIVLVILYIVFISKLEEQIMLVMLKNWTIPDIIMGITKKPLPIDRIRKGIIFEELDNK